jgi:hypothetical protein
MSDTQPPLEYLVESSQASLESFELSRLNRASNLRKELCQVADEWVQAEVSFRLARWILDRKRAETFSPDSSRSRIPELVPCDQLTLDLFPEARHDADGGSPNIEIGGPSRKTLRRRVLRSQPQQARRQPSRLPVRDQWPIAADGTQAKTELPSSEIGPRLRRLAKQENIQKRQKIGRQQVATQKESADQRALGNQSEESRRVEDALARRAHISVRAVTELRALEEFALGPPEMNPRTLLKGGKTQSSLRESPCRAPLVIPIQSTATVRPNAAVRDLRGPSISSRLRKPVPRMLACARRLVPAS